MTAQSEFYNTCRERRPDGQGWPCPRLRHIDLSKLGGLEGLADAVGQFEARRNEEGWGVTWSLPEGMVIPIVDLNLAD